MMWKQKSILIAGLSLIVAALVWSQMWLYLAHLVWGVNISINIFQFCVSLLKEGSFYYFTAILVMNAMIVLTSVIAAIKIVEQYVVSKKFRRKMELLRNKEASRSLNRQFNRQNKDLIVINHHQPIAFSMGFRTPRVVLSTGLIEMLDEQELEAVVLHETYHQKNHDSLITFILKVISCSIWYMPLTKWSYQNYKIVSELSADEYAIIKMGSEIGLGSALIKLIKNYFPVDSAPVIVHFSNESVNYRLQQLINPKQSVPFIPDTKSIVVSIHVLMLMIGLVLVAIA